MSTEINHLKLYRLPWNYADNAISWLEPTSACNLACEGCYRNTGKGKHKTLSEIRSDLNIFRKLRISDCISITGGDPLVHPQITDIVRLCKEMGWKPIVNTNGLALDQKRLQSLKNNGVSGFTFHVDTSQRRPGIETESERDLNPVRLMYARMLSETGDISCSFNATISESNLNEVPDLVEWATCHADKVQTMVFIIYRSPNLAGRDFKAYIRGREITYGDTYKETAWGGSRTLYHDEVIGMIRQADPLYMPSAYLNGTVDPASLKWILATRVVLDKRVMGYMSPRFQEVLQIVYHFFHGRYFSYPKPRFCSAGKSASFFFGLFDRQIWKIFLNILSYSLKHPAALFKRAFLQSIMIIQPINIKQDGRQNMCDGCPDITPYRGQLVWSCRLEEMNTYDTFYTFAPKTEQS